MSATKRTNAAPSFRAMLKWRGVYGWPTRLAGWMIWCRAVLGTSLWNGSGYVGLSLLYSLSFLQSSLHWIANGRRTLPWNHSWLTTVTAIQLTWNETYTDTQSQYNKLSNSDILVKFRFICVYVCILTNKNWFCSPNITIGVRTPTSIDPSHLWPVMMIHWIYYSEHSLRLLHFLSYVHLFKINDKKYINYFTAAYCTPP